MRTNNYILLLCLFLTIMCFSCEDKEVMTQKKGKVYFFSEPVLHKNPLINKDTIRFTAAIQFYPPGGEPVDIEYQLLDDTLIIHEGIAYTSNNIATGDYDNFVFATDTIEKIITPDDFTEETIDVLLDPNEKVTHEDFTKEEDLILRHYSVSIP